MGVASSSTIVATPLSVSSSPRYCGGGVAIITAGCFLVAGALGRGGGGGGGATHQVLCRQGAVKLSFARGCLVSTALGQDSDN